MSSDETRPPEESWLKGKSQVQEMPFRSELPLVGPLISRFREAWNRVATKWYVRPMLAQQNEFNRLVVQYLEDLDARLIAQDREQSALIHDMAELSVQLTQLRRRLDAIDTRLEQQSGSGTPKA